MISKFQPVADDDVYDIVVIGAGPAGLMTSTNLVRWGYKVLLIDDRPTPTPAGRADGLHPRSIQVLTDMGFHDALWQHKPEASTTLNFWIGMCDGLQRITRMPACPPSVDTRTPYVLGLHQGLIESLFLDDMEKRGVVCQRPWTFRAYELDEDKDEISQYPVTVHIQHVNDSTKRSVRAKYLFSGEGARSITRRQAGIETEWKDSKVSHYGVMDGEVDSDFPDIREACVIQSSSGSIMLIPREKPKLVRVYVPREETDAEAPTEAPSLEHMEEQTKRIFHPYKVKWSNIEWLSHYSVRQGVAESYARGGRIFLGGDACHVHSPKMGQGMNLAFADAVNLAWKIHAVESGIASCKLLDTYELERRLAAQLIIDFDYRYTALFGRRLMNIVEKRAQGLGSTKEEDMSLLNAFTKNGRLISGYGLTYPNNLINSSSPPSLTLPGESLKAGSCFSLTADVTRVHDGKIVQFEREIGLDGSFQIYIFAGDLQRARGPLKQLSAQLRQPESFFHVDMERSRKLEATLHESPAGRRSRLFTVCLAFVPSGPDGITDKEELLNLSADLCISGDHIYSDTEDDSIAHKKVGLEEGAGAVLVVRPDGYVALAVQLQDSPATGKVLNSYFARLLDGAVPEM